MVTEETPIKERVDAYVGREFHDYDEIEQLPPCALVDSTGSQWVRWTPGRVFVNATGALGSLDVALVAPFRVTHLIELHEVPVPKGDAPEFTVDASRRFSFDVRTDFVAGESMRLEIELLYGIWWYAALSIAGVTLYLERDVWEQSSRSTATQFNTAEEALEAAWATPEIKGLA